MKIEDLKKKWEGFANEDPLWAILTENDKKKNRWSREEFFKVGEFDAKNFMELINHLMPNFRRGNFLDFGCGVGRMTQAFAPYFGSGTGVDISSKMIALAVEYNKFPEKINYLTNTTNDLKQFSSNCFDMVFSHIVLQHIPSAIHLAYVQEFVRILKPGGVGVFQLPEPFQKDWGSEFLTEENKTKLDMDMYGSSQREVEKIIESCGGKIIQIAQDGACGPEHKSLRYVFGKQ